MVLCVTLCVSAFLCTSLSKSVCLCDVKARQVFFGFQGSPEETTARPGCRRDVWPACTALGQSGVRTRPFSPTLPVMDRRALFRMASENDNCTRRD